MLNIYNECHAGFNLAMTYFIFFTCFKGELSPGSSIQDHRDG